MDCQWWCIYSCATVFVAIGDIKVRGDTIDDSLPLDRGVCWVCLYLTFDSYSFSDLYIIVVGENLYNWEFYNENKIRLFEIVHKYFKNIWKFFKKLKNHNPTKYNTIQHLSLPQTSHRKLVNIYYYSSTWPTLVFTKYNINSIINSHRWCGMKPTLVSLQFIHFSCFKAKTWTGMKLMQYLTSQFYRINLNFFQMNLELPVALYLFCEFRESLL